MRSNVAVDQDPLGFGHRQVSGCRVGQYGDMAGQGGRGLGLSWRAPRKVGCTRYEGGAISDVVDASSDSNGSWRPR